ncbi:MAG: glycosyltransferase [Bacilli bacterium]|nr:glycosyltransferase [Bacilli bacterium]
MKLCVLVSTMFCNDIKKLIDDMNIKTDCIVINQCNIKEEKKEQLNYKKHSITLISTNDRGLSMSRNKALANVSNNIDIIIFTDDDIRFSDDYEKKVLEVYNDKKIDGCSFSVIRLNGKVNKKLSKVINKITMFRVCSVSMSFRYDSIKNMRFDTDFGTGSGKYVSGEENIFICDCLSRKLKIVSNSYVLCRECNVRKSTWFNGVDKKYLKSRGACFARMFPCLYWLFILDFAVRKRKKNIGIIQSIKYMYEGSREYKRSKK